MSTVREHLGLLWLLRHQLQTSNPQYDRNWAMQAALFSDTHLDDLIALAGGADVEGWVREHYAEIPANFPYKAEQEAAQVGAVSDQAHGITVKVERNRVWIVKGAQSFMLAYEAGEGDAPEEIEWYANNLRAALSIITPCVKSDVMRPFGAPAGQHGAALTVEDILRMVCDHTGKRINLCLAELGEHIDLARAVEAKVASRGCAQEKRNRLLAALERAVKAESALRALVDECDNDSSRGWEDRMRFRIDNANRVLSCADAGKAEPVAKQLAHGHREDFYLLANARRVAQHPIHMIRTMPNWALASELFATGSTSGHQICIDAGIDPDGYKIDRQQPTTKPENT